MTKEVLAFIDNQLSTSNINYEFGEWTSEVVYPYFVGEYSEIESMTEDGLQETDFILNGFSRGKWIDLENARQTIENLFNITTILNNIGVVVLYSGSLVVPTGDAELKRIQINLRVKEWKVK